MGVARQIVEKICVIITIILVYENILVFYQHLFPYWWNHQDYRRFFFHLIIGHWLLVNTVIHYYLGITTNPGFVADLKKEVDANEELTYTKCSKCSKCSVMKPPRAHHCKVCQKCVLRYDHHCPWINNCVGYRNHVHFLLFCVYMTMISGYASFVGQHHFQLVLFHDQVLFGFFDPLFRSYNITTAIIDHNLVGVITGVLTLFLFLINLVAMGLVLGLTIWQVSLISKGQTCVEEKIDKSLMSNSNEQQPKRSSNLRWRENWKHFLEIDTAGELIVRLLIPYPFQPKHDGTQWPADHRD